MPQVPTFVLSGQQNAKSFREQLNGITAALQTSNRGASAPADPEAGMLWVDENSDELRIRNQANTAWFTIGSTERDNIVTTNNLSGEYVTDGQFVNIMEQLWTDTASWTLIASGTPAAGQAVIATRPANSQGATVRLDLHDGQLTGRLAAVTTGTPVMLQATAGGNALTLVTEIVTIGKTGSVREFWLKGALFAATSNSGLNQFAALTSGALRVRFLPLPASAGNASLVGTRTNVDETWRDLVSGASDTDLFQIVCVGALTSDLGARDSRTITAQFQDIPDSTATGNWPGNSWWISIRGGSSGARFDLRRVVTGSKIQVRRQGPVSPNNVVRAFKLN